MGGIGQAKRQVGFISARLLCGTSLSAVLLLGTPSVANAQDTNRNWDANSTAPGNGGTGTWNTSGLNWSPNTDGVSGPYDAPWDNALLDNAIFGGTAGTVTLGAPITVHNITFNTANYALSGNTLTLAGAIPTITVNSGTSTINSILAGTAGLTKAGAGGLTLTGNNSFTGNVTVNAGTLTLNGVNSFTGALNINSGSLIANSNAALGNASNVVNLSSGASLSTGTAGTSLAGRTINLVSGQANVNGAGAGFAHFTGTGGLSAAAVGSTGPITFSDNTNDFTGAVTLATNNSAGASFTSVRNIGQASALGAGDAITLQGNSTVSNFNYTGGGDSSNRAWQITTGLGLPTTVLRNAGSGTLTLTGNISVAGPTAFALSGANADLQALGILSSATASPFRFIGGIGTVTLGNANTFTGSASIESGVVRVGLLANGGVVSSLGTGTGVSLTGGTLSYIGTGATSNRTWTVSTNSNGTISNDSVAGALSLSGDATLDANSTLTFAGSYAGGANIFSGVISGSGGLASAGTGTWELTGANTRSGIITVNGGTLRAGSASAFGTTTGIATSGGTLDLNGFNMATTSLMGTSGTVALGSANLALTVGTGGNSIYGGSITGSGSLTKLGAGTLTLSGTNTFTGATTISGGTLALDFSPPAGPTSNILSSASALSMAGGTLAITGAAGEANSQSFNGLMITGGNNTIRGISGGAGSLTLNLGTIARTGGLANFALPGAGAITTANADGALGGWATVNGTDYAKVVAGNIVAFTAADYVNQDNASLWLANQIISDAGGTANTPYFGTVGGDVQIGGLQYTAAANSTVTVGAGNTLGVDGTIIVAPLVGTFSQTITGGSMTGTLGGGVLGVQQNGGGTFTIASQIVDNSGAIGFVKSGTGRTALSGSNSYTGATTVSQGTLSVNSIADGGAASAIGASTNDSSNLLIQGATLEYTGSTTASDRGLTLTRSGAIASDTISVTNAATNLTLSGQVVSPDAANLIKDGAGTLTLGGSTNSYSGTTTVNAGTLAVATLANGGANSSIGASSDVSSNLVLQNGGELEYIGATGATNRGFTVGTGGGAIDVAQGGTVLTVSGVAAGAGTLSKNGAGSLVLSGINTFTGGGFVNGGILRAGSIQAFGTGGWTVASGTTLDLNGFNNTIGALAGTGTVTLGAATLTINSGGTTFGGVITGTGGLAKSGGTTQTFTGCGNNYTGATSIVASTISVDCLANGTFSSGIGASGSASSNLSISSGGTLAYTGPSIAIDRGFTLSGGDGFINVAAGTTLEFQGAAVGGGRLRKVGNGVLVLSGLNTFSGDFVADAGVLRAGSTNAFGTGYAIIRAPGSVDLANFNNSVLGLSDGGTTGGTITLGSATLTLTNGGSVSFNGAISGTGGLVKNGSGAQFLSGGTSSYSGTTVINGGTLTVASLANGLSNSSIGSSGSAASNLVLNGGALTYFGAGNSTNREFTLGGSATINSSGTGAVAFTSTAAVTLANTGARTLTLGGTNSGDNVFAAQLTNESGGGVTSLSKTDAGTWRLSNAGSTYTGVTSILGGVLSVDKLDNGGFASSIGRSTLDATNLVIGTGSTLRYTGAGDSTDRLFTLQAGVSFIESSGTGAIAFTNTGTMGFQGVGARILALGGTNAGTNVMGVSITDGAGGATTVAKNDAGNWYLTGNSTYTGPTTVNAGTLFIGNGGTTGSITSNIVNVTGFGALGFNRSDSATFAGIIQGSGGVTQAGTGTTILAGDSTYTGGTTISAGTLQLGNGGMTGSIVGNVANNGTLAFNRNNAYTFGGTITGSGTIAQIGTGTTTLTAANTAGATTVGAGTLNVNGVLTTQTVAMTGTSTLNVNATTGAGAGGIATFTGDAGASTINVASGITLRAAGDLGGGSDVVNVTGTLNTGAGVLSLGAGTDTFILNGGLAGSIDGGAGTDALQINGTFFRVLDSANVTGFETLAKNDISILGLTGDHSFVNGVTVAGGTLQVGVGGASGTLVGDVANSGTLRFNRTGTSTYAGVISGTGVVTHAGSGTTIFTGNNSHTGATNVTAGTLLINGNQSGATGLTSVASGATLGGSGTIGGSVTIADGGTLAAGSGGVGTLAINGNLALGNTTQLNFEFGQANVPGGPLNDLVNVGGNLTLDGVVNVTQSAGGTFGPGVYRMFNYSGALTNNGLTVGSVPAGTQAFVQTALANQVNLVNTAGLSLSFWDGDAGPKNNGAVNGGNGTWRISGGQNSWTDVNGVVNADYAQDSFAIFQGAAGTVTVDNIGGNVQASGMQFASDGYLVSGGPLTLTGAQALVRVGVDNLDPAYTATIGAQLTGSAQLVKDLAGTLVLSGTNTYTGGTAVNGGTLRIAGDANLGDAAGGLSLNGGALNTTANFSSGRAVELAGTGTFVTNAATTLTLGGVVSGAGRLIKGGTGNLVLTGANTYTGGTTINGGELRIGNGGTTGSILGDVASSGGSLRFNRSDSIMFAGVFSGNGNLNKEGAGTLVLTGNNSSTGTTRIVSGTLQIGSGGTTGSISDASDFFITGGTSALVFNRSDTWTYGGNINIVGAASMTQAGTGTTILTGSKSGSGPINVAAGTLLMNGNASASSGLTSVASGATLGGTGIIGGSVAVFDGGTLAPGSNGVGTLTINGNLALAGASSLAYEFGQSNVVGGPLNDLTQVGGNLTLDGTINVALAPGGNFGPGLYRVISYGGTLVDNGLTAGVMPAGSTVAVQTSVAGQVNLVNAAGGTFNFWDGAAPANESNNLVDGGSGTWQNSIGNNDWTTSDGIVSGPYSDGAFAIFAAAPGIVSVDNGLGAVTASGLQFASDGYTITGQDLSLVGPQSTVRVGDGTALGTGYTATIDAALTGSTQLIKADLGTLVLSGTNAYTGGTQIDAGTLRISSDANLGDAAGGLLFNGGALNTTADITSNRAVTLLGTGNFSTDAGTMLTLNGAITGASGLTKSGAGSLVLTGANGYLGDTAVNAGGLFVNGDQSAATGLVSVASGATLGGSGIIGGNVTLADGATLAAGTGNVGTLTVGGNLALGSGTLLDFEFGQANIAGGSLNDLVNVGGNLVLDGTINVTVPATGSFGPGIYRAFNYGGTLTDNGLALGTMPGGSAVSVQTAIAGQVNLVNTAGLTLSFWDGNAGPKNDGTINGGDGVWRVAGGSSNWTDATGSLNADYAQDSFAIFSAAPGIVTIDDVGGNVQASGLQFASDGYAVTGDALTLTGSQAIVQVGDSSAASAGYTATIASELTGTAGLVKTDAGTLVLTAANSYTGGTTIDGGTLQLGNGGTTGSVLGDIDNNGVLVLDRSNAIALDGTISGTGSLTKRGGGVLTLTGTNSYEGGTLVDAGTVQISSDANLGDVAGTLSLQGGTLQAGASFTSARTILLGSSDSNDFDTQAFDVTLSGTIGDGPNNSNGNFVNKLGAGTLTLTGANTYSNRTVIADGTLALAGAGTIGRGNLVVNAGTVFDISQADVGARVIQLNSGPAGTIALGSKILTLGFGSSSSDWSGTITDGGIAGGTGGSVVIMAPNGVVRFFEANSYTGGTTVAAGTFELSGNGSLFSGGAVTVNAGTTFAISGLAGAGTTIGDFSGAGTAALGGKSLTFGTANDTSFSGTITGSGGSLVKNGTGTFTLSGANSYTGATNVNAGTLLVNGNQSAATGLTSIASGATLGGTGTIGGDVVVADGATLAPGAGGAGALTINGDLSLGAGSSLAFEFGRANAPGDPLNDVVNVGGDLALDGTLNVAVTPGGAFDIGLYRIANYGGTLTDNGLALGTLPAGADVFVQTSVANQVNLINVGGATLNFWDGAAGPKFNGAVNGGDGVWQAASGNDNWADATGAVNAGYDDGAFAIFTGTAGTVTIDDSLGAVTASGLQFAVDGYTIVGDALTLSGPQSVIRVGDGTAGGGAYTATIGAALTGNTQLVKTDLGTLILTGTNSYAGGTAINGGTLRISTDANLGAAAGALSLDGGTLSTAADMSSARAITLAGAGAFLTDAGTTLTLSGTVGGAGSLTKNGSGTLALTGTGSYAGATSVAGGTLLVNGDFAGATGATSVASGASLGGTGTIGGNVTLADGATLTPGAGDAGTLTIGGNLSLAAGTTLAYEFGLAGSAGGALNDLVNVGGDLILDGTINVSATAGGAFDIGVYRVFNYGGTLTNNGLAVGTLPGGTSAAVQTSISGQVNLVNSAGLNLGFWDGAAGPKNNGVINGGNGTWQNGTGNDNWTDVSGNVNAAYSDGAFAVFGGTGGTVTVDNSLGQVTAAGMQFAANGYTVAGNAIALTGPQSTIRVGDGSTAGAGFTATINAALSGDTQLVKTDAGMLILGGTNSYTGGTLINGGTVQISADANLGAAAGDVTLDGGTLATSANVTSARDIVMAGAGTISTAADTQFTHDGVFSGAGSLTKAGAGTLLVTANSDGFAGSTSITAGTLAVTGSLGGTVNVAGPARLEGTGRVGSIVNAGIVAPGRSEIGSLTVAGDYGSNGGVLEIEAELGADNSLSDRLIVNGATSGSTRVTVTNRGGLGAQTVEGIKIVDVAGASNGSFALDGDYLFDGEQAVIAGAFGYRLYKNGIATPQDGDWYLRSALLDGSNEPQGPLYQPGVPLYENYGQVLASLNTLPTLQERVGNRQWAQGDDGAATGIWGRMESTRARPEARVSTAGTDANIDSWKLQIGADRTLSESEAGSLVAGITGHYGESSASVRSMFGDGTIKAKGYGAGATLTWYSQGGFYADAQAQFAWFDGRLTSSVLGTLVDGNEGTGKAFSLELGKRAVVGGGLTVTPQVQMSYQDADFDSFDDPSQARVSSAKGDSLKTRWGISLDHQKQWESNGTTRRSHLYGLVNVSYEWLDGTEANVSGTAIRNSNDRLWGEIALGGSLGLNDRVTIYTQASASSPFRNFGDDYSIKGVAGVRVAF